jgi:hypothetical protein
MLVKLLSRLCYADSSSQDPRLRLNRFFSTLYSVMKKSARAVLQFYPENESQALLIAQSASRVGFAGGVVIDYPNSSKAKKYYLCLSFERSFVLPTPLMGGSGENRVRVTARDARYVQFIWCFICYIFVKCWEKGKLTTEAQRMDSSKEGASKVSGKSC